jgi:predicted oxidoreductase (fatty acid repression mutant protein)
MEVYECIRTRRTIREFKPDPVPEEVVYKILQAARWAPSSSNSQPWHFIVINPMCKYFRKRALPIALADYLELD